MTERVTVPVPPTLSAAALADIADNFTQPLPVATTPGGPAVGWVTSITARMSTATVDIEWLGGRPWSIERMQFEANAVDAESGASVGARALGFIASPLDIYQSLLSRHVADFADEPETGDHPMPNDFAAKTLHAAARNVAAKTGASFESALRAVTATANAPLTTLTGRVTASRPSVAPKCVPALPPTGSIKTSRDARHYLEQSMPGFGDLSHEDKFRAGRALVALTKDAAATGAKLSAARDGKSVALLCLYPGASKRARAGALLAATRKDWANLTHEAQHHAINAFLRSHHVMDAAVAA